MKMKNKTIEEIIGSLSWQVENCKETNSMDVCGWEFEDGVIMSGNDAVKLIELYTRIKLLVNDLKSFSKVKDRPGIGGDFQCCITTINYVIEKLNDTVR